MNLNNPSIKKNNYTVVKRFGNSEESIDTNASLDISKNNSCDSSWIENEQIYPFDLRSGSKFIGAVFNIIYKMKMNLFLR